MAFNGKASSNYLLQNIAKVLNGAEFSPQTITSLVFESRIDQVISSFSYIIYWFISHSQDNMSDEKFLEKQQACYYIISKITAKIPPVLLVSSMVDMSTTFFRPGSILNEFYEPFKHRIQTVRRYIMDFYNGYYVYSRRSTYVIGDDQIIENVPKLLIDFESDISYQQSFQKEFRFMLLTRAPLSFFKTLLTRKNAKILLTQAIIEIIKDLNYSHEVTHEQLLHTFSIIFLYIQAFTNSQDIDGQMICQYLKTRPFLSPFCMLAIVNHIPPACYLFNLLVPSEFCDASLSIEEANKIFMHHYPLVDYSHDTKLNDLIKEIPSIALAYFMNLPQDPFVFKEETNDIELIKKIHKSGISNYDKMKNLIHRANYVPVSYLLVSALNSQLLSCITISFQRTFLDCYNAGIFTPNISDFIRKVMSLEMPTISEQIISRFMDLCSKDPKNIDIVASAIISSFLPDLAHHIEQNNIIQNCLQMAIDNDMSPVVRLLLMKFLRMLPPILIPSIIDALQKSTDTFIHLEYIFAIDWERLINRADEYAGLMDVRAKLIKKLPFAIASNGNFAIQGVCTPTSPISQISTNITQMLSNVFMNPTPTELTNQCRLAGSNGYLLLRLVASSVLISNLDIATAAVDFACEMLNSTSAITSESFFLPKPVFYLPVSQVLLYYLIVNGFEDLSCKLLTAMTPHLLKDSVKIHWLERFLPKTSDYMTQKVRDMLGSIFEQFPEPNFIFKGANRIRRIAELLSQADKFYPFDPESLHEEYLSRYFQLKSYSICSLLLYDYNPSKILEDLLSPTKEVFQVWPDRLNCIKIISRVAAAMPEKICWDYFTSLFNMTVSEFNLGALKSFLIFAPLEIYIKIASSPKDFIQYKEDKLFLYLALMMPNYIRLEGNQEVATKFVCGILESVTRRTKREYQDMVIDAVTFMYTSLRLQKSRTAIINAAAEFPPDLRTLIATSLETDYSILRRAVLPKATIDDKKAGLFVWQ